MEQERIHVAICTPSVGFMKSWYTWSLIRMLFYYQSNPVLGRENAIRSLSYHMFEGSQIGAAREKFVRDVLDIEQATHLLFIDEDMGFREDTLHILLSRQYPIVGCNYRMKIPPCNFTARVADDSDWMQTTEEKNSLEQASMMGCGFLLIERQVLEALESPMFENKYVPEYKTYTTEDRSFCHQATAKGFAPMVDHKASKRVYHMGNWSYSYEDQFPAYRRNPIAERMRTKLRDDAVTPTPAE